MASSFFTLLDDIASLMDDVAATSKIATKQTAGILGDDLAVNAEKATGFLSSREIPVLWSITKGSFLNKLIIVPIVFILNVIFPLGIKIALILGGFYLAYEGAEKIIEYVVHKVKKKDDSHTVQEIIEETAEAERTKIKVAISTDFILSLEIVIIALSTVMDKPLMIQVLTVIVVSIIATVGVYGIVALIVRMDDAGFRLIRFSKGKGISEKIGVLLVKSLPVVIRMLTVVGTIALILVSGGIFAHNIPFFHHVFEGMNTLLKEFIIGLTIGVLCVFVVFLFKKIMTLLKK